MEAIQYDRQGRMLYHPKFHPNYGSSFTQSDLEYLCKYYEHDGSRAMCLALGRPEGTIRSKVAELRKKGLFDYYKNLNHFW